MNIYSQILLFFSILTGILAGFLITKKSGNISKILFLLILTIAVYSVGYAFELSSTDFNSIVFWLRVEYVGVAFMPTLYIIFSLQFTDKKNLITLPLLVLLFSISITTVVLHFTTQHHDWFYRNMHLEKHGDFVLMIFETGPWYWIHVAYTNLSFVLATILILTLLNTSSPIYRRQLIIMLCGTSMPWITYVIYLTGLGPKGIDLSPFGLTIFSLFLAIGLFQFRLLSFEPVAVMNVFESMRDGVILFDTSDNVVNFNPAAARAIKELTPVSVGKNYSEVLSGYSELQQLFKGSENAIVFQHPSENHAKYYQTSRSPITNKKNVVIGHLLTISDITEQKESEINLRINEQKLSELVATKDKFFSIIAHDLKGPVSNLNNFLDLLTDKTNPPSKESFDTYLNSLKSTSEVTYQLLENLLLWSRSQTGAIEFVPENENLSAVVNNIIDLYNPVIEKKKITIRNMIPTDLYASFDVNMIHTVFRNFISNALKYTPGGGHITITSVVDDDMIRCSVSDTGIGMPAFTLEKLFRIDEKVTSRTGINGEKGSGLGLVICKEFIEKHGGTISVNSNPEKGSCFTFSIPA